MNSHEEIKAEEGACQTLPQRTHYDGEAGEELHFSLSLSFISVTVKFLC